MRIAKITVGQESTGIKYNRSDELKTEVRRGQVLENGHVIRGLGTSFLSKEAEENYKIREKACNEIRANFGRKFLRSPLEGCYIVNKKGDAEAWAKSLEIPTGCYVDVTEYDLGREENMDERAVRRWSEAVSNQISRVPLGRGKDIKESGLRDIEALVDCPIISEESRNRILRMINELRVGTVDRQTFRRNIETLEVTVSQDQLLTPRGLPMAAA